MRRGDGCFLYDEHERQYFDALSGLCSVPIGYGNNRIITAISAQASELAYYHAFFHMGTFPAGSLAQKLSEITPQGFDHFLFQSSGSEAVEAAIKLSWLYHRRKGNCSKRHIIARERSYHGNTIFATHLTGIDDYREPFGIAPNSAQIAQIPSPFAWQFRRANDAEFGLEAASWLQREIDRLGADNVAAFVAEPVQGTGGCIVPPKEYWREIRRICDQNDILLICDEVMTGFGRLGAWFGQDVFEFQSDLMCMSKGITSSYVPLGAVGLQSSIFKTLFESGSDFVHGQTCSAHPLACAAAIANINALEEGDLVKGAGVLGIRFYERLASALENVKIVGEIRGLGMMLAIQIDEYVLGEERAAGIAGEISDALLHRGIITRSSHTSLLLSPPLIATTQQLDNLADDIAAVFEADNLPA